MRRTMRGGKIHRATVTAANLHYEGSVTVDRHLLDTAGILEGEAVEVWDVTNGSRLTASCSYNMYMLSTKEPSGVTVGA